MIKLASPTINKEEKQIIKICLKEKSISSAGRFVKKFEQNFSKYLGGKKYSVTTSNGTTAIELALRVSAAQQRVRPVRVRRGERPFSGHFQQN